MTSGQNYLVSDRCSYAALRLLLTHDLGQKTAVPLALSAPQAPHPHLGHLQVTHLVTLVPLCGCTETVPSVKMTQCFHFPKVGARMPRELPAHPVWPVPLPAAGYDLHLLNLILQLWVLGTSSPR